MKIFETALRSLGVTFNGVVKLNTFLTDISNLTTLNEVRTNYLNTAMPPASTLLEVQKLALDGLLIEIEAVVSFA